MTSEGRDAARRTLQTHRALRNAVVAAVFPACGHEDEIEVQVHDGTVRLCGAVRAIEDRDRVIAAAQAVPGAVVVLDEIRIVEARGAARADRLIASDVLQLLTQLPSLPTAALRARVRQGVVTLSGSIPYRFQRDTVLNLLGAIRGVADVVDAVRIDDEDPGRAQEVPVHPEGALHAFAD